MIEDVINITVKENNTPKWRAIVTLLIISNFIFIAIFIVQKNKTERLTAKQIRAIYRLDGESENWKLDGASMVLSGDTRYLDCGGVSYIGDEEFRLRFLSIDMFLRDRTDLAIMNRGDSNKEEYKFESKHYI